MRGAGVLKKLIQFDNRLSSGLIFTAVLGIGILMMASQTGAAMDRALMPLRFSMVDRAASGKLAIVEMDAASAATIKRWPWSRANYGLVVDTLRKAGAASIVFDVDFSSASDAAGDQAFAAALDRASGLVALPTFGQSAGANDRRTIDALPIPILRRNVALASVSITPDPDGQVRTMPFGTITAGTPRPSLSSYIAGRSGVADMDFPIDMSIDPGTISRLSFVAVRDGRFDPAMVRGRNILIGATAIEMGDRYGTPHWGVIPGVVIQALATETLLRGLPTFGWPLTMVLLAAIATLAIVSRRSASMIVAAALGGLVMITAFALIAQHWRYVVYPLVPSLGMILLAAAACLTLEILVRFRVQRTVDEATGLGNTRALTMTARHDRAVIIAVVQIDNYGDLHAVLGSHAIADTVKRVAERLALIGQDRVVYRVADRRMAFLLAPDRPYEDTLHGLRSILLQPVEVGGRRVDVAISIGIASGGHAELDRLLVDATLAADAAHNAGVFWRAAATDLDGLERSISLMGELDEAMDNGQIEVFYQPKYHLRERRITSVEALVRWRHPVRGFIGPDLFIPLAESSNRIAPLTLHVLAQVVRDLAGWRHQHPDVTAAVNISAKLLSSASFNADVERLLESGQVPAAALVFEVTESAAMSDTDAAIAALRHYRDLGIAVSMDDYGTGQSTLTYLRRLPLNELKIDRSFVQHAHQNRDDGVLVRSTIELAHQFGLKVVAEGVEDDSCLAFLEQCGCDLVQGYLISRPVPLVDLQGLLISKYRYAA